MCVHIGTQNYIDYMCASERGYLELKITITFYLKKKKLQKITTYFTVINFLTFFAIINY